jgi:two-component sensor histidine kinase
LLYIQSETAQDKEAKIAIKEAQNRVRSMVLIHQKLYSKDQLVGIDAKEYFEDFTKDVIESHQFENTKIQFKVTAEPMVLDIETITPIGLILNELITNVLKHAFPTVTTESCVHIQFRREKDNLLLLVEDNGTGMPAEIKESSFGLELIRALCEKLKATLTMSPGQPNGTSAQVVISRFTVL